MNSITGQVILATGELYPKSALKPGLMLLGAESKIYELKSSQTCKVPTFEIVQKRDDCTVCLGDQSCE
jgi:hypothetical protein